MRPLGISSSRRAAPPSSPSGVITFQEDFEAVYGTSTGLSATKEPATTGGIEIGRTWTTNATNTAGATIGIATPPVPGAGSLALKAFLPASSSGSEQHAFVHRYIYLPQEGEIKYYGRMFLFPSDWQAVGASSWIGVNYLAYSPFIAGGGMVNFAPFADSMKLVVQAGYNDDRPFDVTPYLNNGGNYEAQYGPLGTTAEWLCIPAGQMNKNVWHELIIAVKWVTTTTGFYKTWWKRKGESTWTQTLNQITNQPTFWWGWDYLGNYYPPEMMGGYPSYQPFGLYTAPRNFNRTIWMDNYVEGSSFEIIAATMP